MVTSNHRGHGMEILNDVWIYSDNKKPVSSDKNRSCGNCGKDQTDEGHDGCLKTLPYVMNACCGHGKSKEAYIQLLTGWCIRGKLALLIADKIKILEK